MAHDYSVLLHDWIGEKKKNLSRLILAADQENNREELAYCQGQMDELMFLRQYMADHIDLETQTYFE